MDFYSVASSRLFAHDQMQGRREGGGATCFGLQTSRALNLRNILKLNKASSKSGRVQGINGSI